MAESALKGARESGGRTLGAIFFHRPDWALFTPGALRRLTEHLLRVELKLGDGATARSLRRATVQWVRERGAQPDVEAALAGAMGHSVSAWNRYYDVLGGERRLRTATDAYEEALGVGGAEWSNPEEEDSAGSSSGDGAEDSGSGGPGMAVRTRSLAPAIAALQSVRGMYVSIRAGIALVTSTPFKGEIK